MKKAFIFALSLIVSSVYAQSILLADKELLGKIAIGESPEEIQYYSNDEGFYSPGGIFIDSKGGLFFIQNIRGKPILHFSDGNFIVTPVPPNLPNTWYGPSSCGISQNGLSGEGSFFFTLDIRNKYEQTHFYDKSYMRPVLANSYPIPNGVVWTSLDNKQLVSAVFDVGKTAKLRTIDETRAWLPSQPGGFSIGEDGLLYRYGILWSAKAPFGAEYVYKYLGRLMSGHQIWVGGGTTGLEKYITISNSAQQVEIVLELPWAGRQGMQGQCFDYGLGPWGELYYLLAPPWKKDASYYVPEPGVPAELVVVRNHLKYFGRTNADNVRMRTEPNTAADIILEIPRKMGFRILERNGVKETIEGKTSDWVKVRYLDGREGWIFGAYMENIYDGPGTPPPWPNIPDW